MASAYEIETTELGVMVLQSTAGVLEGRRYRAGVEASYVIGPASFRGEFLWRKDEIQNAPDTVEERVPVRAWYGQITSMVFGAEKVPESGLTPARPLDFEEGHWGALELVFRVAGATVGDHPWEAVGNSLSGQSNRVVSFTVGANWYPVRNVRFSGDWILEDYRRELDFSNGIHRRTLSGCLFRAQVEF